MLTRVKQVFVRNYQPLNTIVLSRKKFQENYQLLKKVNKNIQIAPVLKSNAYGHGIGEVGKIADSLKAPFLCVDSLYEAYALDKLVVKTPILIMGYVDPESLKTKKLPFSFAVSDVAFLKKLAKYQPKAKIHIFVDTGMGREGVPMQELGTLADAAKKEKVEVEGLMSHLALPDKPLNPFTQRQIVNFKKARELLKLKKIAPKWVHIASSIGLFEEKIYKGLLGNAARCGISLYGIDPTGKNEKLKPILSMSTRIAQIKQLKKGDKVGYDFTYEALEKTTIAILPVGYNDGIPRALSNKGFVKVKQKFCPIIGRVSMNITTIDVANINVKVGDSVEIFSSNSNDKNSVQVAAKLANTIPYVILTNLHTSTKRTIV